jgi:hypothetical protein
MARQKLDVNVDDRCFRRRHSPKKKDIFAVRYCYRQGGWCHFIQFWVENYTEYLFYNAWSELDQRWETTYFQSQEHCRVAQSAIEENFMFVIQKSTFPFQELYFVCLISFHGHYCRKMDLQWRFFYTAFPFALKEHRNSKRSDKNVSLFMRAPCTLLQNKKEKVSFFILSLCIWYRNSLYLRHCNAFFRNLFCPLCPSTDYSSPSQRTRTLIPHGLHATQLSETTSTTFGCLGSKGLITEKLGFWLVCWNFSPDTAAGAEVADPKNKPWTHSTTVPGY